MKRYDFCVVPCVVLLALAAGCGGSPEDAESDVGEALSAWLNPNSLVPGALSPNAALTPAMLRGSALSTATLSAASLSALRDPGSSGGTARQLLEYTVGCALPASQSVSLSWVDSGGVAHNETYWGLMSLATSWATGPLDAESEQRWVSACLASRANYYGITVSISSRGAALATTADEISAYSMLEGAFWGNLFTASPTVYTCDHVPDDAHSRSLYRVCAAGLDDGSGTLKGCGIIQRVGSCATACGSLGSGLYYASCSPAAGQASSSQVVTVFLQ